MYVEITSIITYLLEIKFSSGMVGLMILLFTCKNQ